MMFDPKVVNILDIECRLWVDRKEWGICIPEDKTCKYHHQEQNTYQMSKWLELQWGPGTDIQLGMLCIEFTLINFSIHSV